ncbi:C25 family cysteine peptidase [Dyadobacter sp. CY356]|uniref:putative type IX secretion system sortase PorU2 n=1 Tax=Dyadobacter sp. CY356 TaxID=2906442 RepID=UPI001F1B3860|nr:C25 family cysteine peptidase [Dyadobacter sp. CY356]MCF0057629.1 C25 family cysteine peptidase [Dyadobacter sp. CY356]
MEKLYTHYLFKIVFLVLLTTQVSAQNKYANEWINTSQTYLRIPVVQTGIYKISASELRQAGFPVDSFPVTSLQLFRRGQEIAIEVNNNEERLNQEGSLTFFGESNDGALDSSLYVNPKAMPHAYYSLYSDTASYFLTYNKNNIPGKRIAVSENKVSAEFTDYHLKEVLQLNTTDYPAGNLYPMGSNYESGTALTTYDYGEGWTGKEIINQQKAIFKLTTENAIVEKFDQAIAELLLVGRNAGSHQIEIRTDDSTGRKLTTVELLNYDSKKITLTLEKEDLSFDGKISVSVIPVNNSGSVSVSYIKWIYPQKLSLSDNNTQTRFYFNPEISDKSVLLNNTENWEFYDCSKPDQLKKLIVSNSILSVNGASQLIAMKEPMKILTPAIVKFKNIKPGTDYLIISHPLVRKPVKESKDPVEDYAVYRASQTGGNFKTLILNSQEIFDQFNYGEPGPQGIRNAISFLHEKAELKFVLLLGRSIDPQTARHQPKARENDMIPNAGWPGSDIVLAMGLQDSSKYIPLVPVGRVNAANAQNVYDYLQKVKAFESQNKAAPWRKNILHLSGGHTDVEREIYREYIQSFEKAITPLGNKIITISKQTNALKEDFPLDTILNKGVGLITLYGHSSLNSTDVELGFADDQKRNYKNDSLFPAIIMNGCALGNSFYTPSTISNNWILAPKKGAVLFLSHTHNGVSSSLKNYTDSFYEVLADTSFTNQSFGIIQQEAIRRNMLKNPTLSDGITSQQMNLQGDPAIKLFPATIPDYAWKPDMLRFSNPHGKTLAAKSDSIEVKIGLVNFGKFKNEELKINIYRMRDSVNIENYQFTHRPSTLLDTISYTIPNIYINPGNEIWTFTIDPKNEITEENKNNNLFSTELLLTDTETPDTLEIISAYVSPNPSGQYFKFNIELEGSEPPKKWNISVFDKSGRAIQNNEVIPHLGKNEFIWQPKGISPGVYLYRMKVDAQIISLTPEAKKGISGKLIWMH